MSAESESKVKKMVVNTELVKNIINKDKHSDKNNTLSDQNKSRVVNVNGYETAIKVKSVIPRRRYVK